MEARKNEQGVRMKKRNLPIGQSSFERIIKNDYIYVDKTWHIYNLITSTQFNFLSRPRRFGKSLLISTLEQIFKGNKELFKGLWIYDADYQWEEFPVVRIDFNQVLVETPETLKEGLVKHLQAIGKNYEIALKEDNYKYVFMEIIITLYEKYKKMWLFSLTNMISPLLLI